MQFRGGSFEKSNTGNSQGDNPAGGNKIASLYLYKILHKICDKMYLYNLLSTLMRGGIYASTI